MQMMQTVLVRRCQNEITGTSYLKTKLRNCSPPLLLLPLLPLLLPLLLHFSSRLQAYVDSYINRNTPDHGCIHSFSNQTCQLSHESLSYRTMDQFFRSLPLLFYNTRPNHHRLYVDVFYNQQVCNFVQGNNLIRKLFQTMMIISIAPLHCLQTTASRRSVEARVKMQTEGPTICSYSPVTYNSKQNLQCPTPARKQPQKAHPAQSRRIHYCHR